MGWRTFCAGAAALVPVAAAWQADWTRIDVEAVLVPALVELTVRKVPRCPHCGWIESKREIAASSAAAHAPVSHEYTIRMGDGSSHVFREEMPMSWRLGERLMYIEGSGPLN
jgi:hypothetical protein